MVTRVLATGVFDLLHPGHIYYLRQAKELGTHLTVVVTSDQVAQTQGKKPFYSAKERQEMLSGLKVVDRVIIGNGENDYCQTIKEVSPDIIALGYDQEPAESLKQKLSGCAWNGQVTKITKYPEREISTTHIATVFSRRDGSSKGV